MFLNLEEGRKHTIQESIVEDLGHHLESRNWDVASEEDDQAQAEAPDSEHSLATPQVSHKAIAVRTPTSSSSSIARPILQQRSPLALTGMPAPPSGMQSPLLQSPFPEPPESSLPNASGLGEQYVKICGMCKANSSNDMWFTMVPTLIDGKMYHVCVEDICWVCGTATEAWPLIAGNPEGRAVLVERYKTQRSFRKEFDPVRAGVKIVAPKMWAMQAVQAHKKLGMVVKAIAALIEESVFQNTFKKPTSAVEGVIAVTVYGPADTTISGGLVSPIGLPSTIPHFIVELFSQIDRCLLTTLLPYENILRPGQAQERFVSACKQQSASRGTLTLQSLSSASKLTYDEIVQATKVDEADLRAKEAAARAAAEASGASFITGSALDDSVLDGVDGVRIEQASAAELAKKRRRVSGVE